MSVSKYKIFMKVIEAGSLTKAAQQLGYTQSAVSHAINALESETGLTLIKRSRIGVFLTAEGERLMPSIERIVEAISGFEDAVNTLRGTESGSICIGAFTSVAVHWLPAMIKEYKDSHPNVEFRMLGGDYHDIAQWLSEGSIDIAFVTKKMKLTVGEYIPLTDDDILAVLPKDHRLAGREVIEPSDIEGEPFISLLENSAQDARSVLEEAGVSVDVRFTAKDDYAIIAMVEQGLGISIMPALLLEGNSDGICTAKIKGGKKRTIGIALSAAGAKSPAAQNFARFVQQWVDVRYSKEL